MSKVLGTIIVLSGILVVAGSILPERETNTQYQQCIRNTDNMTEATIRAQLNNEYSGLAIARELNNICRKFS